MSTTQPLTKELIKCMLLTDRNWLERGILAIDARQTASEQRARETRDQNGMGWSGFDARYMGYLASWIRSGKHLNDHHFKKASNRMQRYAGQLLKVAKEKAQA